MARVSDHILVQQVGDAGVVIMDESSGDEIVIDFETVPNMIKALQYFMEGK